MLDFCNCMFISNTTSANVVICFDRVEVKKANEILALGLKIITFFNLLFRKLLIEKKNQITPTSFYGRRLHSMYVQRRF